MTFHDPTKLRDLERDLEPREPGSATSQAPRSAEEFQRMLDAAKG